MVEDPQVLALRIWGGRRARQRRAHTYLNGGVDGGRCNEHTNIHEHSTDRGLTDCEHFLDSVGWCMAVLDCWVASR